MYYKCISVVIMYDYINIKRNIKLVYSIHEGRKRFYKKQKSPERSNQLMI